MFRRVMVRIGPRGIILAGAALGVAMAAAPASAQAANGNISCTTYIGSTVITGNVTVPAGASCYLDSDTVEGSVSVHHGATFEALGAQLQGNLYAKDANTVYIYFSEVDGNSSIDATSGTSNICGTTLQAAPVCAFASTFGTPNPHPDGPRHTSGNVSIINTSPKGAGFADNSVAGNLTCSGNTFVTNFGYPNTVEGQESGQCAGL